MSKTVHIEDEIALASKTGELTKKLRSLHKALLSIPATSVESERAFSVAGSFAIKIQSQLSDKLWTGFVLPKVSSKIRSCTLS